jgi:ethanolamine ammonia-lyase large subunit
LPSPASAAWSPRFRNTIGLPGRLAVRLQPNHPTDDARGIAASMLDGLLYGVRRRGDRHQPGHRQPVRRWHALLRMLDELIRPL